MIVVCADLFAGKPAPTGLAVFAEFVFDTDTVGAGLPAKRPDQSPQYLDNHYRSRIASVRAFNTGLSR